MGLFRVTMRLSEEAKNSIIAVVRRYFSQVEKIILFDSRVDDNKQGGNMVDTSQQDGV